MKVFVTGASGNVGKHVVKELIKLNEEVVAGGRSISKLKKIFNGDVVPVVFDFIDTETYKKALKGVDRVFIMRPPHIAEPEKLYPFIDALKVYGIKFITFLSLMGIEKNPIPPHYKIEKYIEASGINYSHIRPGFFMQNISGLHAYEIRMRDEVLIPAGKSKTSFIDAADIGLAIAMILNKPNKYKNTTHTITGPKALDYFDVARILTKATGRLIKYNRPGFLKYRNHMINNRNLDKKYVNVTLALYFMTRMGTANKVTNDFYEITGKKPRSFEIFVEENIDAFMPDDDMIHKITFGNSNCYLISKGDLFFLIDTELPGLSSEFINVLKNYGVNKENLELIILTHGHVDHVGNAIALKNYFNSKIAISEEDASTIKTSNIDFPKGHSVFAKALRFILQRKNQSFNYKAFEPDILLKSGESLDNFGLKGKVIALPGHTLGSIGILIKEDFFVGDAAMNIGKKLMTPIFGESKQMMKNSIKKINEINYSNIHTGH